MLDAKEVLSHAFRLGLVLVVAMGFVRFLVVITCRRFGGRGLDDGRPSPLKVN